MQYDLFDPPFRVTKIVYQSDLYIDVVIFEVFKKLFLSGFEF